MARFYYYVVTAGNNWAIKFDGQLREYIYATQAEAIAAASEAARAEHAKGFRSTGVRVQGANSSWRDEMSYGNDPFPPAG